MQRTEQAAGATLRRAAVAPLWRLAAVTHWPAVLAAAVTVVLAMPTLNYVYGPDQALFAYFGNRLAHGAGLYVDVWDVKPPGIFWIYALITRIPGPEFQDGRPQDMAGVAKADLEAGVDFKDFVLPDRREEREAPFGVLDRVERGLAGPAPPAVSSALPLGFRLLHVRRVEQQDLSQFHGRSACVDFAPEAVADEFGKSSAVVDVGVGEKDGGNLRRIEAPWAAVLKLHFASALEQAAVDQVFLSVIEQKTRAGDTPGRSQASDLHAPPPQRSVFNLNGWIVP